MKWKFVVAHLRVAKWKLSTFYPPVHRSYSFLLGCRHNEVVSLLEDSFVYFWKTEQVSEFTLHGWIIAARDMQMPWPAGLVGGRSQRRKLKFIISRLPFAPVHHHSGRILFVFHELIAFESAVFLLRFAEVL